MSNVIMISGDDAMRQTKDTNSNETGLENNVEQSNVQNSNLTNSVSNSQVKGYSHFARTFATMLGSYYGISSENINRIMRFEKDLMAKFQKSIESVSKVLKNSFSKEVKTNPQENKKSCVIISNNLGNVSHDIPSGIRIGDNRDLPIIVSDSDDDRKAGVIVIDSDEEEIQEFKKMMSFDDLDCTEIDKNESQVTVADEKKEEGEITDHEIEDETFIPLAPGVILPRKRQRKERIRTRPLRRKIDASKYTVTSTPTITSSKLINIDISKWRKDLPAFPYISDDSLRVWATGFLHFRKEWERLEYLGDKVLMFCVLKFATVKFLQSYSPVDIKVVATLLVTNKLLAAYSLTLGLYRQNKMPFCFNKKVADAFEAYIGAYYLSDGEEATTKYLNELMSPLFELTLSNIVKNGKNPGKIMVVIANYFNMSFLMDTSKLK